MKFLCSFLILVSSFAAYVQAKPNSSVVSASVQNAMKQYLLQQRDFDVNLDPDVTSECFQLYLPMLNEVAASFSSQYQQCIAVANEEIANITSQAASNQQLYKQEVTSICSAFTSCDSDNDTVAFFNCYAAAAQSDVSVIYDISTNAASTANSLSQGIQAIQDTEYQCTNTTESNYVRDTAATYDLLDSCLKNGLPTTSTAVGTVSTTAATTLSSDATADVSSTSDTTVDSSTDTTNAPEASVSTDASSV
ncbi:papilin-like [Scaptodrosophila lebanonensis]|uniref:Papilin-like n=1 Tax=Drosophila lebanonensis TaxID=7225 RepID=A0A6J2UDL1_DROLE|nr:papilin-like [Scaptodrosophila lebanonensis]